MYTNKKQKGKSGIVIGIGGKGAAFLLRFVALPFALLLLCLNEAATASSGWSVALAVEEIEVVEREGAHQDGSEDTSTAALLAAETKAASVNDDLRSLIKHRKADIYREHNIFPDEYGNEHQEENPSDAVDSNKNKNKDKENKRRRMLRKRTVEERTKSTNGERNRALEDTVGNIIGNDNIHVLPETLQSVVYYEVSARMQAEEEPQKRLPGKKGIGFTLRDKGEEGSWVENMPLVIFLKPYWNYSWGSKRVAAQPDDIEFIPMIWGARSWGARSGNGEKVRQTLEEDVMPLYKTGVVKRLLGFNEPDSSEQADMKVDEAANVWPILESTGMLLASPAVTHNAQGGEWMRKFMYRAENRNLRMDYIAVHWYEHPSATLFKYRMQALYQLHGGKPLLITEMAVADWYATTVEENRYTRKQVLDFMKIVIPWMEQQPFIVGYAWFPFEASNPVGTCSSLFRLDGTPTALGLYYASVRSDNPQGDQSIEM